MIYLSRDQKCALNFGGGELIGVGCPEVGHGCETGGVNPRIMLMSDTIDSSVMHGMSFRGRGHVRWLNGALWDLGPYRL
jgi:hypothetical protein